MQKLVGVAVAAALAVSLAGCATTGGGIDPHSKTTQGAVLGGLGGAAVGAIAGPEKALQNAAIGGAVGAVGGGLIGNQMEKQENRAYQQGYYDAAAPPPPRRY